MYLNRWLYAPFRFWSHDRAGQDTDKMKDNIKQNMMKKNKKLWKRENRNNEEEICGEEVKKDMIRRIKEEKQGKEIQE
jgi:hypothetical protein